MPSISFAWMALCLVLLSQPVAPSIESVRYDVGSFNIPGRRSMQVERSKMPGRDEGNTALRKCSLSWWGCGWMFGLCRRQLEGLHQF